MKKPGRSWVVLLSSAGCGAGLMYYLDPDRGRRRRKVTLDRSMGMMRRAGRRTMRLERRAIATMAGKARAAQHLRDQPEAVANDQMLTDRILSQAFRDIDFPHRQVNVNVEERVAVLRGVVDQPEHIRRLEEAVGKVPGVEKVESYLHLPNSPAPGEEARH
jgi:hypothetical protein